MAGKNEDRDQAMPLAGPRQAPAYDPPRGGYQRQGIGETVLKSLIRSIASSLGRIIVRAVTGRGR